MTYVSRRIFSRAAAASFLVPSIPLFLTRSAFAQSAPPAMAMRDLSAESWMSEWLSAGRPVSGALYLQRFKDPWWILMKPISWKPDSSAPGLPPVTVPEGFTTDLASVPRLFWSMLRPDGEYAYAAIIHDYLYWRQPGEREQADLIFWYAMQDFKIDRATAWAIWGAVRAGASGAWEDNRNARLGGARRILRRYPEDPGITWESWKTRPDVFVPGSPY